MNNPWLCLVDTTICCQLDTTSCYQLDTSSCCQTLCLGTWTHRSMQMMPCVAAFLSLYGGCKTLWLGACTLRSHSTILWLLWTATNFVPVKLYEIMKVNFLPVLYLKLPIIQDSQSMLWRIGLKCWQHWTHSFISGEILMRAIQCQSAYMSHGHCYSFVTWKYRPIYVGTSEADVSSPDFYPQPFFKTMFHYRVLQYPVLCSSQL